MISHRDTEAQRGLYFLGDKTIWIVNLHARRANTS